MKQSKRVNFDRNLSVIVLFQGKQLDLTDFCQKHPGGKGIIQQFKGKSIDDVIFNPKMHRHNPAIRKKLLSFAVQKNEKVLKKSESKGKQIKKEESKENILKIKPSLFKVKQKSETEENYSVEEIEGNVSQIPVFETHTREQKLMEFPVLTWKITKRRSWNTN